MQTVIRRVANLVGAVAFVFAITGNASAATMHYSVSFSANSFVPYYYYTGTAPVDPVVGSFDIMFDPTKSYSNETSGITFNNLNLTLGSAVAFDYNHELDYLLVGGTASGVQYVDYQYDFGIGIQNFLSNPSIYSLLYSQKKYSKWFVSNQGSVTVDQLTPVPIPLPLFLFASGLGLIGLLARHSKRTVAAVA